MSRSYLPVNQEMNPKFSLLIKLFSDAHNVGLYTLIAVLCSFDAFKLSLTRTDLKILNVLTNKCLIKPYGVEFIMVLFTIYSNFHAQVACDYL